MICTSCRSLVFLLLYGTPGRVSIWDIVETIRGNRSSLCSRVQACYVNLCTRILGHHGGEYRSRLTTPSSSSDTTPTDLGWTLGQYAIRACVIQRKSRTVANLVLLRTEQHIAVLLTYSSHQQHQRTRTHSSNLLSKRHHVNLLLDPSRFGSYLHEPCHH